MFLSPKTRLPSLLFLLVLSVFLPAGIKAGQDAPIGGKDTAVIEPEKELSVKIDGISDDKAWATLPFRTAKSGTKEMKFKIHSDDAFIYLLVVFPSEKENRQHMLWHWDPLKQYYSMGNEKEDELYIIWPDPPVPVKSAATPEKADVWIWRAARTDPAGYADDYYMLEKSLSSDRPEGAQTELFPDQGLSGWLSKYFVSFTGDTVPRFYQRPPEGSAADVKAKGTWNSGFWTVEFRRKLNTGHSDDINLSGKANPAPSLSTEPPVKAGPIYPNSTAAPVPEVESK